MMWRHWVAASFFLGLSQGVFHPAVLRAQGILREVPFDRKLVASTGVASDRFGAKLAISGDTLVASAPNATVDGKLFAGAAYVFMRDPAFGRWVERKRLIAQDGVGFDQFASTLAIDGNTIVLGASRARAGGVLQQGVAYVFERDAGGIDNWGQVTKLTDDSVGAIGNFGSSISLKGSGIYADIAGPGSVTAARMAVEDFGGSVLGRP